MSQMEKLLEKFKSVPKDLTWNELVKILGFLGYSEVKNKGKTGGSRYKFSNKEIHIINLHKPRPSNIVIQYVIRQLLETLEL